MTGCALRAPDHACTPAGTYDAQTGKLTFAAGKSTDSFTVNTASDSTFKDDEPVVATISNPSDAGAVEAGKDSATATIVDDDDFVS